MSAPTFDQLTTVAADLSDLPDDSFWCTFPWGKQTGLVRRVDADRYVAVIPYIYTWAVIIGRIDDVFGGFSDRWCYHDPMSDPVYRQRAGMEAKWVAPGDLVEIYGRWLEVLTIEALADNDFVITYPGGRDVLPPEGRYRVLRPDVPPRQLSGRPDGEVEIVPCLYCETRNTVLTARRAPARCGKVIEPKAPSGS